MVLPILGLLGAAGAAAAAPHYNNYSERVRGNRRADVLGGATDPTEIDRRLFEGGILDPESFSGNVMDREQGALDRSAAMARTRVSSGPAYMNAQLQRERFEAERADIERQNSERERMRAWTQEQMLTSGNAAQRTAAENPFTPAAIIDQNTGAFVDSMLQTEADRVAEAASIASNQGVIDTAATTAQATNTQNQGVIDQAATATQATNTQNQAVIDQADDQAALQAQYDELLREDGFVDDMYYTPGSPAREWAVGEALKARGVGAQENPIIPSINEALRVLDDASFRGLWGSTEGTNVSNYVNEVMSQLRADYWQNTLGRTDAPGEAEVKELQQLFPAINPGMFETGRFSGKKEDLIRSALRRGLVRAQGGTPSGDLGAGWVVD